MADILDPNMKSPSPQDFHIGIIYVKPLELFAITPMLDDRFSQVTNAAGDPNQYILGRIGHHNVVVAGLNRGEQGTVATAQSVSLIRLTFPNVKTGLLVGIGGGIPHYPERDVRLGDVVVGAPEAGPAVIQYDLGKRTTQGFMARGTLSKPPESVRQVVNMIEEKMKSTPAGSKDILQDHLDRYQKYPKLSQYRLRPAIDRLFKPTYDHVEGSDCATHEEKCEQVRSPRTSDHIYVHTSTILSGNSLVKIAKYRDRLSKENNNALCFEMEAAGLMDILPCLVIRGISDYADSHKNDQWQCYAAATAAAYAREVLLNMSEQTSVSSATSQSVQPTASSGSERGNVVMSGANNLGNQTAYNYGNMSIGGGQ